MTLRYEKNIALHISKTISEHAFRVSTLTKKLKKANE